MGRAAVVVVIAAVAATAAFALLEGGGTAAESSEGLQVVAAENVWGSIAAELGGNRVHVTSIVRNPAADPHDYEPTSVDARALAGARMTIVNGVGYDPWASKLLAANPVTGRVELDVGDLVGIEAGGNPHRWYSPRDVQHVVAAIARSYAKLDPKDAAYFARRRSAFVTRGLASYRRSISSIARRFHGMPVGASESIFEPLARALGLDLRTPRAFLGAISEGAEPTAEDVATIDRQVARRQIAVWVYNSQNSTPDVQRITDRARARGIPVVAVTETLSPASATFQDWQSRQLRTLQGALARAAR